jgi:hypothetical protein
MEITRVTIRDRGATPRRLQKVYTAGSKTAWSDSAKYFHATYRPKRFTQAHGLAAGFKPRSGDNLAFGSRAFWRSYVGRKLRLKKHRHPLEWSGRTREGSKFANIVTTRVSARIKYPNVRVLNFKPGLQDEFRRLLKPEARQLGRVYDGSLNRALKADKATETRTI